MNSKQFFLFSPLILLHSFFFVIVIAFLLEPAVVGLVAHSFLPAFFERFIQVAMIPVRIYFYAGVYGVLLEMLSGESAIFNWKLFHANAKRFWLVCASVSALLLGCNFLTFGLFPERNISLAFLSLHFEIILASLTVSWLIARKYLTPFKIVRRKITINFSEAGILLGLCLAQIILFYLPRMIVIQGWDVFLMCTFISRYVHFLIFLYIAQLILNAYPSIEKNFTSGKELILINPMGPGLLEGIGSLFIRSYPPAFVVLKALTPTDYRVREFNRVIWHDRYYQSGRLVAITCFTSNCYEAYAIAKEFKRRGSKVVMGGPHVTYLPDEALEYCDSVVIGEAEGVWKQVVADYEKNNLQKRYLASARQDYHQEIHQALLHSPPEVIKDYLETSRGCKFRCHFCTIPALSDGRTRQRPVFEIVELLEKVKTKFNQVTFIDNNIYNDPSYAKSLFEAIKPLKIGWSTQCTIDIAKNDETLKLARESGCTGLLFGYEIFGDSLEKEQRGKLAMAENYIKFTRKIQKMGIQIKAHFIFGHESDRYRDLWSLWKFCFSLSPLFTVISILTPLPGAALYQDILKQDRLTNLNWRSYACHALVFRHPHLNSRLLSAAYPFLYAFFLLTTSKGGRVLLVLAGLSLLI